MSNNKKGFSIMELIIVVVIIGVLASFAIPKYTRTVERSIMNDAVVQLQSIHSALLIENAQRGQGTYLDSSAECGGSCNLSQLNTELNINITANGMTYSYLRTATNTYNVTAVRTGGSSVFTLTLTQSPLSSTNNPICSGSCPCSSPTPHCP
jgi:prepilin-type N-terminal cleavage/methylation domain-containing protein